jgi:hypothetical protein
MKLACKKLDIPYGRYTEGGMIFHDTRHTFVSNLLENEVDLETTRDLAGLSRDMILRYAHTSAMSKRKAADVLDRISKNGSSSRSPDFQEGSVLYTKWFKGECLNSPISRVKFMTFGHKPDK